MIKVLAIIHLLLLRRQALAELKLTLQAASPWFLFGANPRRQPELRAASIRGQLRYWLRALIGAQTTNLSELWKQETAVFGSTGNASPVSVYILPQKVKESDVLKVNMLPHRSQGGSGASPSAELEAVKSDTNMELCFITRPGVDVFPQKFAPALSLWLLLGGLGKRSRRMFGAPHIRKITAQPETLLKEAWWTELPRTQERFVDVLKERLTDYLPVGELPSSPDVPSFPTLHPSHSWIIVGKERFRDYEEANRELFSLLRNEKYRPHSDYFGFVRGSQRRASPLIAQIRQFEDHCYPVLTFMRSRPYPQNVNWKIVNEFMKDAIDKFDGEIVWGGAFS